MRVFHLNLIISCVVEHWLNHFHKILTRYNAFHGVVNHGEALEFLSFTFFKNDLYFILKLFPYLCLNLRKFFNILLKNFTNTFSFVFIILSLNVS